MSIRYIYSRSESSHSVQHAEPSEQGGSRIEVGEDISEEQLREGVAFASANRAEEGLLAPESGTPYFKDVTFLAKEANLVVGYGECWSFLWIVMEESHDYQQMLL